MLCRYSNNITVIQLPFKNEKRYKESSPRFRLMSGPQVILHPCLCFLKD
uniref:Uncharacterized protein n=1 Tax=Anguilla anguilla TaxID=7936 RepID=A0A0E9QHB9_ANGAN